MAENDDDGTYSHGGMKQKDSSSDMNKITQAGIVRYVSSYMQQQGSNSSNKRDVNMVHHQQGKNTPFDGHYAFSIMSSMENTAWVMDSGASTHISSTPELFNCTYKLNKPIDVHLTDGSSKRVISAVKVRLNKDIST